MIDQPEKPETKRAAALAERRRLLLDAAIQCFLEKGYHQTGVRDIARCAGVSLGNLYNHFPGKHDILAEIAVLERQELAPFLKMLASPSPAADVIRDFIAAYFRSLGSRDNAILSIEIMSEAIRKPDIAAMFMEGRNTLATALSSVIQRGVDERAFRAVVNTEDAAHLMLDLIESAIYRKIIDGECSSDLLDSLDAFLHYALAVRDG